MGDNFAGRSNRLPLFGELRGDADLGFSEKRALGTTVNDKICRFSGTFLPHFRGAVGQTFYMLISFFVLHNFGSYFGALLI